MFLLGVGPSGGPSPPPRGDRRREEMIYAHKGRRERERGGETDRQMDRQTERQRTRERHSGRERVSERDR